MTTVRVRRVQPPLRKPSSCGSPEQQTAIAAPEAERMAQHALDLRDAIPQQNVGLDRRILAARVQTARYQAMFDGEQADRALDDAGGAEGMARPPLRGAARNRGTEHRADGAALGI